MAITCIDKISFKKYFMYSKLYAIVMTNIHKND